MMETHKEKSRYLRDLFSQTYIKDVLERHQVKNDTEVREILLNVLAYHSCSTVLPVPGLFAHGMVKPSDNIGKAAAEAAGKGRVLWIQGQQEGSHVPYALKRRKNRS